MPARFLSAAPGPLKGKVALVKNLRTKRSQALLAFAFIALTIGVIQLVRQPYPSPTAGLAHTYLPQWVAVGKWFLAAGVAVWAAATCRHKWGYYALVIVVSFRAASYLVAWVLWLVVHPDISGDPLGWVRSLEYLGFAAMLIVLAGPDDGTVAIAEVRTATEGDNDVV